MNLDRRPRLAALFALAAFAVATQTGCGTNEEPTPAATDQAWALVGSEEDAPALLVLPRAALQCGQEVKARVVKETPDLIEVAVAFVELEEDSDVCAMILHRNSIRATRIPLQRPVDGRRIIGRGRMPASPYGLVGRPAPGTTLVPNTVGLRTDDALDVLCEWGLSGQVMFDGSRPPRTVSSQAPTPGTIARNRRFERLMMFEPCDQQKLVGGAWIR